MTNTGAIHIGTSCWHYRHWIGPFYPEETTPKHFFEFYARFFRTVEINNSFYRLPSEQAFTAWRLESPEGFLFACKAPRYITHMTKLNDPARNIAWSLPRMELLEEKLGPILFQLPPRWRVNPQRLAAFLEALPREHRYAFEFRDETWFAPEVYALLEAHNAALCVYHMMGRAVPLRTTADFVYLRLHGPEAGYRGSYSDEELRQWAEEIYGWRRESRDVYCYFDNDDRGYAVRDALRLRQMVEAGEQTAPS